MEVLCKCFSRYYAREGCSRREHKFRDAGMNWEHDEAGRACYIADGTDSRVNWPLAIQYAFVPSLHFAPTSNVTEGWMTRRTPGALRA